MKPKYPVYIISKGRAYNCLTANRFEKDKVKYSLVIEPQEEAEYIERYDSKVLVLPFSNLGKGSMPARNWVWDDAKAKGFKRHWIFDDNIRHFRRLNKGRRLRCNANIGISVIEEFTDRYTNIAISGFNYTFFAANRTKPFTRNCHIYSALLIDNNIKPRWRMKYNEDTDLCLQALHARMCTVLFSAFTIDKMETLSMKGGNMDKLYKGDGRLKMARSLEKMWPQYVTVKYKFGRPQHVIKDNWACFKQPLIRRTDIDWNKIKKKKYNIKLKAIKDIKSPSLKRFYEANKTV